MKPGGSGENGRRDGAGRSQRRISLRLADFLARRSAEELFELWRFWGGTRAAEMPSDDAALRRKLAERMADGSTTAERLSELPSRAAQVLGLLLRASAFQLTQRELAGNREIAYMSPYDIEAALVLLSRRGFISEGADTSFGSRGGRCFAVPLELAKTCLARGAVRGCGAFPLLTLRGYLERRCSDQPVQLTPTRGRELYKLYANEEASVRRVQRLDDDLRELVEKAVLQFGGLLSRAQFERMSTKLGAWNARRFGAALSEALVGCCERLELSRFGIQHSDETLVVFNEVALAWLRRVAAPGDPERPEFEACLGVDLVSNLSRFESFILQNSVRFTVRGRIFKTTERRILQELIPNPGREMSRAEVLTFIYDFARHTRLIEHTGERTFVLTDSAREWEEHTLEQKLRRLLEYVLDEAGRDGDPYHQSKLRRVLLRLLKRVEPETWYDLMYLPFLARNTYLASLDERSIDEHMLARARNANHAPMEDLQRMAWNLAKWIRQRLYLLGIVDLGYDERERPVALRLTRVGARLFGLLGEFDGAGGKMGVGSLVVTPDFEVVMFSNGDDAELVHELDRFCTREKSDHPIHFRISDRSIQRGLSEGVLLARILATLNQHSRTPVPQNVLFSIRDWALRGGLMVLDRQGVLRCEDPEALKRFRQDPAVRGHVREALDEKRLQLKTRYSPARLRTLLHEHRYPVELEE